MQKVSILTRTIVIYEQEKARRDLTEYNFQIIEIKIYSEDGAEAGDGAQVVLNFWANLRLAVLTRVVLTQEKACTTTMYVPTYCMYFNGRNNSRSKTQG